MCRSAILVFALALAGSKFCSAEDQHEIDFHVQGGSFDLKAVDKKPGKTLVTIFSKEPITKLEAERALDELLGHLRQLRTNDEVVRGDFEIAERLIPQAHAWINKQESGGVQIGKSYTIAKEDGIRIDCEAHKGFVLVDNLPHAFELTVTAWGKPVKLFWKNKDNPGRKVGRKQFDVLKEKAFKEWGLKPSNTSDPKVELTLAAWRDGRQWFENVVLKDGIRKDKPLKSKKVTKTINGAKIEAKFEVHLLNGVAFIEED